MREVYGVSAVSIANGYICNNVEFGIQNMLIEGNDIQVHDELEKMMKSKVIFDKTEPYLIRAPHEDLLTDTIGADTTFLIRIDPRELNLETVRKNTVEWDKRKTKASQ